MKVLSGLVSTSFIEQVRFRQRPEGGEGESAKRTSGRGSSWESKELERRFWMEDAEGW